MSTEPLPGSTELVRTVMRQTLTKKSRTDLSHRMIGMCQLTGWQSTTLNPDLDPRTKLSILAEHFGKIAVEDDDSHLYDELVRLSAVSMGWAQGIERRGARERKRRSRERKRARKAARRDARGRAAHDLAEAAPQE